MLRGNHIMRVPRELRRLGGLTRLDLSHNAVIMVPSSISELRALTDLDLSHNALPDLPAEVWPSLRCTTCCGCPY